MVGRRGGPSATPIAKMDGRRRRIGIGLAIASAMIGVALPAGGASAQTALTGASSERFAADQPPFRGDPGPAADDSRIQDSVSAEAASVADGQAGLIRIDSIPGPFDLASMLGTTALKPDGDTFVSSDRPDEHFGSDSQLCVGQRPGYGATRALLHFKHTDLDRKEAVTGARLRLYLRQWGPSVDASRDLVLRQVTDGWKESEASWNRFPDSDDSRLASNGVGTGSGWQEWESGNVMRLVQKWRYPAWQSQFALYKRYYADNHGLYLQGYEAAGSYRCFDSANGSNKPELRLEHVTDTKPPTSALVPLPLYTNAPKENAPNVGAIRLEWGGSDPEPATEIDHFQLYFKRQPEAWALAADKIQAFSGVFGGDNGRRYGFRIQAVDQAGNIELGDLVETETLVDLSPPTSTLQALPAYVSGDITLNWAGSDFPVGPGLENSGIATYNILYTINNGGWDHLARDLPPTTTSFKLTPLDGLSYAFEVYAVDKALNRELVGTIEAQTIVDRRAPTTFMEPVLTIDQPAFMVRWGGNDPGGSGIDTFDIQVSTGTGPWTDWLIGTRETSAQYSGQFENVYSFRSRAKDKAGNVGNYTPLAQMTAGVLHRDRLTNHIVLPVLNLRLAP